MVSTRNCVWDMLTTAAGWPIEIDCNDHTGGLDRKEALDTPSNHTSSNHDQQQLLTAPATPQYLQEEPSPVPPLTLATNADEHHESDTTGYEQREDAQTIRLQRALRKSEARLRRERRRRIEVSKRVHRRPHKSDRHEASQGKLCPICLEAVCN